MSFKRLIHRVSQVEKKQIYYRVIKVFNCKKASQYRSSLKYMIGQCKPHYPTFSQILNYFSPAGYQFFNITLSKVVLLISIFSEDVINKVDKHVFWYAPMFSNYFLTVLSCSIKFKVASLLINLSKLSKLITQNDDEVNLHSAFTMNRTNGTTQVRSHK